MLAEITGPCQMFRHTRDACAAVGEVLLSVYVAPSLLHVGVFNTMFEKRPKYLWQKGLTEEVVLEVLRHQTQHI